MLGDPRDEVDDHEASEYSELLLWDIEIDEEKHPDEVSEELEGGYDILHFLSLFVIAGRSPDSHPDIHTEHSDTTHSLYHKGFREYEICLLARDPELMSEGVEVVVEYVCDVACRREDRMQGPRDASEVRPKSCRHDYSLALIHIVYIPDKWLLHDPPIGSGDLAECSVCSGCDCEFEHMVFSRL